MEWLAIGGPVFGFLGVAYAAYMGLRGKRGETNVAAAAAKDAALAERFDDASQLAQYIRDEVERQVAPIREEMQNVKRAHDEMHDAFRARETQLWLWDNRGRPGSFPLLPEPIMERLGLRDLLNIPPTNLTEGETTS